MKTWSIRSIALAGMIAAYYVLVSFFLQPISYGALQFRVAEALTVLPLLFPEAIWGLGIGCFLTNLSSPFGIYDWGLGTLATLIAASLTFKLRKQWPLALAMPVVVNGLIVGSYVSSLLSLPYWSTALYIALSQTIIVYGLGLPLLALLRKTLFAGVGTTQTEDKNNVRKGETNDQNH